MLSVMFVFSSASSISCVNSVQFALLKLVYVRSWC